MAAAARAVGEAGRRGTSAMAGIVRGQQPWPSGMFCAKNGGAGTMRRPITSSRGWARDGVCGERR
jgi:hypothetical protein